LKEKRDLLLSNFQTLEGLQDFVWEAPQGAFYFFPNVEKYLGRKTPEGKVLETDLDLAKYILQNAGVVLLPGSKFKKPGYFRIAFALSSKETIQEGCKSLSNCLLFFF